MRRIATVFCIIVCAMLNGCAFLDELDVWGLTGDKTVEYADVATLGITSDEGYVYLPQSPKLITDREGYEPSGKKVVFLRGGDVLPDYSIIDMKTGENVFSGSMTIIDLTEDESLHLYVGDFSEFTTEGEYRIYQKDVGYSYDFYIKNNLYQDMYREAFDELKGKNYTDSGELIYVLSNILLTKDIYADAYMDEAFIDSSIDKLLRCQDAETGAVSNALAGDGQVSLSNTAEFAGLMAYYYSLNSDSDSERAANAMKAATQAYSYIDRYSDNVTSDSYYYAATQMYRASGQINYRNAIAAYDQNEEKGNVSDYGYRLLADVAYLKSKNRVDYNRCEAIMKKYLTDMVELSDDSDRRHYYVQSDIDELTDTEILDNMMQLGIVSYVVSGHEYASVKGNYIHFLMGVNDNKRNYLYEMDGDREAIYNNAVNLSKLIFVLASSYELE